MLRTAPLILVSLLSAARPAPAALEPSADPVTTFIVVADSVFRTEGSDALAAFVEENDVLVGAAVASLLDIAFDVAATDPAGAADNVSFAKQVVAAHEAAGGSGVARGLVETFESWSASQRTTRARAIGLEAGATDARRAGDLDKAVNLLGEARALYEKLGDRHSVAVNWGSMGVAHWGTGDWDVVIADYENALAARRAVEDRILEGRTLNGLGSAYQQKADYDRAIEYYAMAIDLRRRTGDLGGLGTSITYLGHVYNHIGRFVDARRSYEEALPILESLGDPRRMVEILSGIALLNKEMGRMEDANAAYARAIELASAHELGSVEALCRRNLADNYRDQGRFAEALDELEKAGAVLERFPDPVEGAVLYQTRGLTYLNMGEFEDARTDLLKFVELAKELDNVDFSIGAQLNVADLYRATGAHDRALKAADAAREQAEAAGSARNYRAAMATRGDLFLRMGRYEESLAAWQEALAQDEYDGAHGDALTDRSSIAGVRAMMGQATEAREAFRALLPVVREAELPELEWVILLGIGHTFEKENADSAAFYYERALSRIEASGAGIGAAAIQTGYLSGVRRLYYEEVTRFYASCSAATGDAAWSARAFHTIERAKARGLLQLLQASVAERTTPEEGAVLDQLYTLDPKQPDYADQRAALERRYAEMRRARVSSAVGELATISIRRMDEVARELPGKAVLLEYALGDSASFLWVVDRKSSDLVELPPRPVIESEVQRFRDALARVDAGDAALMASSRRLYELLVAPAGARLEKADVAIIVPDGALFELPFEVLLTEDAVADGGWGNQPFLARAVATLYAPSASVYASLKGNRDEPKYTLDLFAAGNPDFAALAQRGGEPLQPLPHAEEEVMAIGARVKDSRKLVVTGAAATESTVKRELRSGAPRVVHLATHGLVDPAEPARSSVALTPDDGEDGYFHTLEILAIPTRSGVVVMSACESARGKVSRGEGVVGLSRAFLAAGAGSVVASLWAVSDESTAELMRVFYGRMLGRKQPASKALNEARLALIDEGRFAHPFFWSPFIVTGTERSPW